MAAAADTHALDTALASRHDRWTPVSTSNQNLEDQEAAPNTAKTQAQASSLWKPPTTSLQRRATIGAAASGELAQRGQRLFSGDAVAVVASAGASRQSILPV